MHEKYKVQLDLLNATRPSVKTEDLIGEVDGLVRGEVWNLLSGCTWSGRDVFRTQLLLKPT